MWGFTRTSEALVKASDIGKTVFWTRKEAQASIDFLIKERRNAKS
jgi:hypothetical protein